MKLLPPVSIPLLILLIFLGCTSSSDDIEILGSWSIEDDIFTVTNEEVSISDYAKGTVGKYDNENDYAVIFFDEHVSPVVNQKYSKVVWTNLTATSVTLIIYEPQDSSELAEASITTFQTVELVRI
jgi:hypothetical protein